MKETPTVERLTADVTEGTYRVKTCDTK